MAKIIDGNAISSLVREDVTKETRNLQVQYGITPGLAVVLIGSRKDSETYVRMKKKAAVECGFYSLDIVREETISQEELEKIIEDLNADSKIHGILVQLPLPNHINEANVLSKIRFDKDVDGFSAVNMGRLAMRGLLPPLAIPCTPAGCIELLQRSGVECKGKHAVVVGRSNIVGLPVALLLLSMDCTVTICHSKTPDMENEIKRGDIVIAAVGKPELIRGSWIKPGAVIIDVGINPITDPTKKSGYRLVGDVCFEEALKVASLITPVPGGVGPMTIAMLMKNTLNLARQTGANLPRIPLRTDRTVTNITSIPEKKIAIIKQDIIATIRWRRTLFIAGVGLFGFALGLGTGMIVTSSSNNNNNNNSSSSSSSSNGVEKKY